MDGVETKRGAAAAGASPAAEDEEEDEFKSPAAVFDQPRPAVNPSALRSVRASNVRQSVIGGLGRRRQSIYASGTRARNRRKGKRTGLRTRRVTRTPAAGGGL